MHHSQEFAIQGKKMLMRPPPPPPSKEGGWAQVELTDALLIR